MTYTPTVSSNQRSSDWKQGLIQLRRRLISLPAELALQLSNHPWFEKAVFYPRYQAVRDRHRPHLPALTTAIDQKVVDTLKRDGVCRTSLEELNIPNTEAFLAAARAIFAELEAVAQPGQGTLNTNFRQLMTYPDLFLWGLSDRLLHIAENYLEVPIGYDTFTCTLSVKQSKEAGTRLWHIDHEDRRMIKLIVYLTDVDEESGPFQYIRPEISDQLEANVPSKFDFLSQTELETYLPRSASDPSQPVPPEEYLISCTGKAGTVLLADTARAYHRGKPPMAANRHAVFFGYLAARPRHPFRCGRSLLTPEQLDQLSKDLPPKKQAAVHWQAALPLAAKLIPRYRYYKL